MADGCDDVPSVVDFQDPDQAQAWAERTHRERPYRSKIFDRIREELSTPERAPFDVLELGSGPGILAESILSLGSAVRSYTLIDFSQAMLDMSRERLGSLPSLRFLALDFRDPAWTSGVSHVDTVVSVQAVHELRHKRRAPALYTQINSILKRGGVALVCDHLPGPSPDERRRSLYMTVEEQLNAFRTAGFRAPRMLMEIEAMVIYRADATAD